MRNYKTFRLLPVYVTLLGATSCKQLQDAEDANKRSDGEVAKDETIEAAGSSADVTGLFLGAALKCGALDAANTAEPSLGCGYFRADNGKKLIAAFQELSLVVGFVDGTSKAPTTTLLPLLSPWLVKVELTSAERQAVATIGATTSLAQQPGAQHVAKVAAVLDFVPPPSVVAGLEVDAASGTQILGSVTIAVADAPTMPAPTSSQDETVQENAAEDALGLPPTGEPPGAEPSSAVTGQTPPAATPPSTPTPAPDPTPPTVPGTETGNALITAVSGSVPHGAYQGANVTVTATVRNEGSATARELSFVAQASPGFIGLAEDCPDSLGVGETCTLQSSFQAPGEGVFALQVEARFKQPDATETIANLTLTASGAASATRPAVVANYTAFPKWNDYITRAATGAITAVVTPSACPGGMNATRCVHAGEMRKIVLQDETTCDGLTAEDKFGAFDWFCTVDVLPGGAARPVLHTTSLRKGAGLGDLIAAAGTWRENEVTVRRAGVILYRTEPDAWWDNAIVRIGTPTETPIPGAHVLSADESSKIYYYAESRQISTISIRGDRIAVVVRPGVTLTSETAQDGVTVQGPSGAMDMAEFAWIEGKWDGDAGNCGISTLYASHTRLHRVRLSGFASCGVRAVNSSHTTLRDVRAQGDNASAGAGFEANMSAQTMISDAYFAKFGYGVRTDGASTGFFYLHDTTVSGNDIGVYLQHGGEAKITGLVSLGNQHGLSLTELPVGMTTNVVVSHFTDLLSGASGLEIKGAFSGDTTTRAVINSAVVGNAGEAALLLSNNLASSTLRSVAFLGKYDYISRPFTVEGVGASSQEYNGIRMPPAADAACIWTSSFPAQFSNNCASETGNASIYRLPTDQSSTFTPGGATADYAMIDWLGVGSDRFTGYGRDGDDVLTPGIDGRCSGDTCRLWSARLVGTTVAADSAIYNLSHDATALNPAFRDGEACPVTAYDTMADYLTVNFLRNAREILFDAFGNEDGLCQQDEVCYYAPHLGAYQGETVDGRAPTKGCVYGTGSVTGVTMRSFHTD